MNKIKTEKEYVREFKLLTPYREIRGGELSIYDYVTPGYKVPDKVIKYLQTTQPRMMSPGIYQHPFKPGHRFHQGSLSFMSQEIIETIPRLLGPYWYQDGIYEWDRDTWKYVVKYGLRLPQEFIDHAMSDAGTLYLEKFAKENVSWSSVIKNWNTSEEYGMCLLPDDLGDMSLENF